MLRALLSLSVVVFLVAADEKEDAKKAMEAIKGTWTVTSATINGTAVQDGIVGDKVTFENEKLTIEKKDSGNKESGSFKLNAAKDPKEITVTPPDGSTHEGIYTIKDDELKLCLSREGGKPTAFESKEGSNHMLITLKKNK